ncbi:MAG: hypothetical protein ACREHV_11290, partial [Rhizomicrobium sp.]
EAQQNGWTTFFGRPMPGVKTRRGWMATSAKDLSMNRRLPERHRSETKRSRFPWCREERRETKKSRVARRSKCPDCPPRGV